MTFLAPAFLWTLVALAPLVAIYFLKVRPRKKPVTAYFLWEKIFTEKKASALFKRLRDLWSLLLLALAFAAIAFGLAEPDFAGDERKDLLIVVDNSASMSAREGGVTRLELAKRRARALIIGMNGSQRASVASFASQTSMRAQPSRHRKTLLDAVDAIEPTALPSRAGALRALQPGNEWMENTRVLLITDGCLDSAASLPALEVLRAGAEAENAGIVRADLRPVPGGDSRLGLFLLLVSSYAAPVSAEIALTHVDSQQLVRVIPVTLQPGENPALTVLLDEAPAGRWTASLKLNPADALEVDDTVWLNVPEPHPVSVGVLADDPYFLENVVTAFDRSDRLLELAPDAAKATLLLSRGQAPAEQSAVVFQPQGESPFWSAPGEELAAPVPKAIAKDHPLLRYLAAESINFAGARQFAAPAGAVVLVADEGGTPLIHLMRRGGQTVCVLNLDPVAARFYLSAWFPVLVHNAAAHLTNREGSPPATVATGDTLRVPGLAPDAPAVLAGPAGERVDIAGSAPPELREPGFYEVTHAAGTWPAGCSLVAPEESQLRNDSLPENARPVASGHAPAYWLIVLAAMTLTVESVLYHRRKVG